MIGRLFCLCFFPFSTIVQQHQNLNTSDNNNNELDAQGRYVVIGTFALLQFFFFLCVFFYESWAAAQEETRVASVLSVDP